MEQVNTNNTTQNIWRIIKTSKWLKNDLRHNSLKTKTLILEIEKKYSFDFVVLDSLVCDESLDSQLVESFWDTSGM